MAGQNKFSERSLKYCNFYLKITFKFIFSHYKLGKMISPAPNYDYMDKYKTPKVTI